MRRSMWTAVLMTVLLGMLIVVFKAERVKAVAVATIYIGADGSIYPSNSPIERDGDLYILTDNVSSVVIERDNMTLDGAGLTLQGSQASSNEGIYVYGRSNVTITNIVVEGFYHGIWLDSSSSSTISRSHILANRGTGIVLSAGSQDNIIIENNITGNSEEGIFLLGSSNFQKIVGNNITANKYGISLYVSSNNVIYENNILHNNCGIRLQACSNNMIYHNNFVNNTTQVSTIESTDIWDIGYPLGGNYWSDYDGLDLYGGPRQNLAGGDNIGDMPYPIDMNNWDRYPLVTMHTISEFPLFLILPLLMVATLVIVVVCRIERSIRM